MRCIFELIKMCAQTENSKRKLLTIKHRDIK